MQTSQSSMHADQPKYTININHHSGVAIDGAVVAIARMSGQVVELQIACCANSKPHETISVERRHTVAKGRTLKPCVQETLPESQILSAQAHQQWRIQRHTCPAQPCWLRTPNSNFLVVKKMLHWSRKAPMEPNGSIGAKWLHWSQ